MNNNQFCGSRLPCGLCMVTQTICPFYARTVEITCDTPTVTATGTGQSVTYSAGEFFSAERRK